MCVYVGFVDILVDSQVLSSEAKAFFKSLLLLISFQL